MGTSVKYNPNVPSPPLFYPTYLLNLFINFLHAVSTSYQGASLSGQIIIKFLSPTFRLTKQKKCHCIHCKYRVVRSSWQGFSNFKKHEVKRPYVKICIVCPPNPSSTTGPLCFPWGKLPHSQIAMQVNLIQWI